MDFNREERVAILVLGFCAGFIIGLDEMITVSGTTLSIDYTTGLFTLLVIMAGMLASVFWHELCHKFAARWSGYYTHTSVYPAGIVLGVALSLFTFGWVQFFTPNPSDLEANPRARIAKHRKYENWKQQAFIAGAGIVGTGLFAVALQGLFIFTEQQLFRTLLLGNIWLMVYSLVPFELINLWQLRYFQSIEQLPQSDGLYLLHYSIYAYIFVTTFVIVLSLLLYFTTSFGLWLAICLALTATLATWWHYFKNAS
jgi:hypothetical protein